MKNKQRLYSVYHIRPIGETDTTKFYIGITKNTLSTRLSQHMCSTKPVGAILRELGKDSIEIVCLHKEYLEDALRLESEYRPAMNIGWNVRAGGNSVTVKCTCCGKPLPKRRTGAMCSDCNDCRFTKGNLPVNYGTGIKARLVSPEGVVYYPESITRFCAEHGLVTANVRKVIKGLRKHTLGWTASLTEG